MKSGTETTRTAWPVKPSGRTGTMNARLQSRLARLEQRRREQGEADDPKPSDFAELCGYPRGTMLSTIFKMEEERMAR